MTEKYAYCSTVPRTFVGLTVFTFLTYSATAAKNYIIHPVRVVLQRCHITTGRKQTFHHAKSLIFLTVRKFTTHGNHNIAQKPEAKFLE